MVSTKIDIDKYRYMAVGFDDTPEQEPLMDTNLAAWMIAGGPRIDIASEQRNREQLHAFRESQHVAHENRPGWIQRLRQATTGRPAPTDLACCPA
jgi:hypothetical protein